MSIGALISQLQWRSRPYEPDPSAIQFGDEPEPDISLIVIPPLHGSVLLIMSTVFTKRGGMLHDKRLSNNVNALRLLNCTLFGNEL